MKKYAVLLLMLCSVCFGSLTHVPDKVGAVTHSIQSAWVIADTELVAGTEPDALGLGERTYLTVKAIIAANSGDDGEITIFPLPAAWNGIRLRSVNETVDSGNVVYEIYFGTLGNKADCDLVYAAQLDFTSGKQISQYFMITFTSGGPYVPQVGDTVTGNSSGKTAVVIAAPVLSGGSYAAGDAAGKIQYRSSTGTFTNSETIKIGDGTGHKADVLTHAASNLLAFEYADTLTLVQKSWIKTWGSISPLDDTIAEGTVDTMGADIMVIVASTCDAEAKLLVKGF